MPMANPLEHLEPFTRMLRPQLAEDKLATCQWRALILIASNDEDRTFDVRVHRWRRVLDSVAVGNVTLRVLGQQHLADEALLRRGGIGPGRAVWDAVRHGFDAVFSFDSVSIRGFWERGQTNSPFCTTGTLCLKTFATASLGCTGPMHTAPTTRSGAIDAR